MNSPDRNQTHGPPTPEAPVSVDASRPPQWNSANCPCDCGCACSRGAGNKDGDEMPVAQDPMHEDASPTDSLVLGGAAYSVSYATSVTSDYEDGDVNGEEGVDNHFIEVGDLGFARLRDIHRALARHDRCTCHHGILPNANDYPFDPYNSPQESAFLPSAMIASTDSMDVEMGSRVSGSSMASSMIPSIASGSSSRLLAFMGEGLREGSGYHRDHPVMIHPLPLTPEPGAGSMSTGSRYPTRLTENDLVHLDCW